VANGHAELPILDFRLTIKKVIFPLRQEAVSQFKTALFLHIRIRVFRFYEQPPAGFFVIPYKHLFRKS